MKNIRFVIASSVCLFLFSTVLWAQNNTNFTQNRGSMGAVNQSVIKTTRDTLLPELNIHQIIDSVLISLKSQKLNSMARNADGTLAIPAADWVPFGNEVGFRDTVIINPAFLPVVFDGKILPDKLTFLSPDEGKDSSPYRILSPDSTFVPELKRAKEIAALRRNFYRNYPREIRLSTSGFSDLSQINSDVRSKSPMQELLSTDDAISITAPTIDKLSIKQVYWVVNGDHQLQISQNSISDNWAAGGTSSFSIINQHRVTANYKKNKISFNNTLDWKLNMQRTPADTVHSNNVTLDYLEISNVLGLDAFIRKWSYTVSSNLKTPLFNIYPINSTKKTSALLSPMQWNVGLGMSYTLTKISKSDKHNNISLTTNISPISINYVYVRDSKVNGATYGLDAGEKSKLNFGLTVKTDMTYSINRYASYIAKLKFFTDYGNTTVESENKLNYSLNRYLSMSVSLYLTYDDRVAMDKKDDKWGYFQYNQMLGFGLAYKW